MAVSGPARNVVGIIMNVLVVVAIALTIRVGVVFFGQFSSQEWGRVVIALTNPLVIPFGIEAIKTPYGGVFDVDASITIVVVLIVEYVLSLTRAGA